jgi:hypothetical protein
MSPFWNQLCQDLGRNGRNGGTFFFFVVLTGLGLLMGTFIMKDLLGDYFPIGAGLAGLTALGFLGRAIQRARQNRARYEIQPLAREEIRRARSKLIETQKERKS